MAGARAAGRPVAGSIALAFRVLISETASAPPCSAATATAAGSATFGVSFTISGFAVSGRSASSSAAVSAGCSPTIRPEWTFGQETLSSIAATSSRPATPLDQLAEILATRRHHRDDQRHRQLAPAAAGRSARKPSRPLLGRPIELIIPAGVSQIRGGALPAAGLRGDRLRDEGGEREVLEQRVAEGPPRGDRVEGAGGVDHRMRQLDPQNSTAECSAGILSRAGAVRVRRRARPRGSRSRRTASPITTHPRTGAPPGRRRRGGGSRPSGLGTAQPKQAPKPQAIGRLHARARRRRLRARHRSRARRRASPAGRRRRRRRRSASSPASIAASRSVT